MVEKLEYFKFSYLAIIIVDIMGLILFFQGRTLLFYSLTFILFLFLNVVLFKYIKIDELAAQERKFYRSILKDAQDINLYVVDRNMNYLLMSKSDIEFMEKYFKVIPEVGKNLSLYLSEEHYQVTRGNLEEAFKGNLTSILDHFVMNEEELFIHSYFSPLYDEKNEVYAMLCFSVNLTSDVKNQQENYKLVYRDPLTGLYNRRKLREYFEEIHHENNQNYWMFLLDIDNFKSVNDTKGHLYGDSILIKLTECLIQYFPKPAKIFRIGGDEFCVIMEEEPNIVMEELIKNATFSINEEFTPHSISLGFARINGSVSYTFDDYYEVADRNMYNNKKDKQLLFFIKFNQMGRFTL